MSTRREYDMSFIINGQLTPAFSRSFQQASREMRAVSSAQNDLNSRLRDISSYQRQQRAIERQNQSIQSTTQRLDMLRQRNEELHRAMDETTNPSERLRQQLSRNENAVDQTSNSLEHQRQTLQELQTQLDRTGTSLRNAGVNTEDLSGESERLRHSLENLTSAQENLNSISSELRTARSEFKDAAKDFVATAGTIAAAVGTVYASTSKQAIDFESAFAGVKKTVDGTPEQLAEIRKGILEMSQADVPSIADDIAAVAENAGQLGIETENILKFSRTMIDLGNSTNLGSEDAASSLAKFANVTKMSQSNFDRLGSVIVDLGNNFATTEADIVAMGTRLASTGELTGLSEAEIMGVATALSSLGIEAEAGGSAMSKFLKFFAVADATGGMKKYADIAGMTTDAFSKLYKKDSLAAISAFTKGLNDTERNGKGAIEILNDMGITEIRLSNAVLSLASSDGILTKAVERANKAWEENTALSNEAAQRYVTTESKIEMAKNSVRNLGIAIGDMTLPLVRDLANDFGELAQRAQRWVSENGDTIISFAAGAAEIAKYVLVLKGAQVAYKGFNVVGLTAVKGVAKVKTAIAAASAASAAGGSGVNAFASSLTGLTAGASGFVAVGAATIAVMAAIAAAVYLNDKAMQKARKDFADGLMFKNGLPKLKDYTEALKESTSESYKFAQEINATKDEIGNIGYEMSQARASVELYGISLRENGTLSPSEAQNMIEPFNNLVSALEQDFTVRYTAVFDAFKLAASQAAENLGVDVAQISTVLDTFKEKYTGSLNESQKVVDDLLNKRADGGQLSGDELKQLQEELAYISKMSDTKSEALYNYQQMQQQLSGMDIGNNQEQAIANIKELQQYAADYLNEIDEAQKTLNRYYDDMREKANVQLSYGKISDEEYSSFIENLNLAQGVTYESYAKKRGDFTDDLQKIGADLSDQINSSIIRAADEKGISFFDSYIGTLSAYGNFFTGKGFTGQAEAARGNAINSTRKIYQDIIDEVDNLRASTRIDPIMIPVEIQTYVNRNKEDAGSIPGHAFGTSFSESTFLAGELGPEIVTNAPAHTVYTAEETRQIFDGYKVFSAILPQALYAMSAMTAASVSAPTVANYGGNNRSITINYNPVVNASSGDDLSSQMEQHDNEFFERLERYFENKAQDERRNAYF